MAPSDSNSLYTFDNNLKKIFNYALIGTDEAGRGPLAGPVVAAAVQLDLSSPIDGINDSKKLTMQKRETLYTIITEKAIKWSVGSASRKEIDDINVLQASLLAMKRALDAFDLASSRNFILVDGNKNIPSISSEKQLAIIQGDGKSASIAAASIIAKVTRDRIMKEYHEKYPLYQFDRHKGYPTAIHRNNVLLYGLCPIHRRTFCEKIISQTKLAL